MRALTYRKPPKGQEWACGIGSGAESRWNFGELCSLARTAVARFAAAGEATCKGFGAFWSAARPSAAYKCLGHNTFDHGWI